MPGSPLNWLTFEQLVGLIFLLIFFALSLASKNLRKLLVPSEARYISCWGKACCLFSIILAAEHSINCHFHHCHFHHYTNKLLNLLFISVDASSRFLYTEQISLLFKILCHSSVPTFFEIPKG